MENREGWVTTKIKKCYGMYIINGLYKIGLLNYKTFRLLQTNFPNMIILRGLRSDGTSFVRYIKDQKWQTR